MRFLGKSIRISKILLLPVISGAFLFQGCDMLQFKQKDGSSVAEANRPIARVNDIYLYPQNLKGIVQPEMSKEDSISMVQRYIKSWIRKQLLIAKAQQNIDFDEMEIERKVLDYRYALMMHEFEKIYVNNKLNTEITNEEIRRYYEENQDNFELDQNIVRGIFVKLPKKAPKVARFRYLLKSNRAEDFEELKSYCYSFATKAHLEDSIWIYFTDLYTYLPSRQITDEQSFLRNHKYYEASDDNYMYFLRIDGYKLRTDTSPPEFAEDEIRKIILHKRKVKLAKELERNIYDEAVKNNDFEIFNYE